MSSAIALLTARWCDREPGWSLAQAVLITNMVTIPVITSFLCRHLKEGEWGRGIWGERKRRIFKMIRFIGVTLHFYFTDLVFNTNKELTMSWAFPPSHVQVRHS